jgi:photosystem II stability/assembly factor-like uncharacterized protein
MINYRNLFLSLSLSACSLSSFAQWRDVKGNIDDEFAQGAYYNDLCFLNQEYGWAVGNGSTILQFDGMGWRKQQAPENSSSSFFAISLSADTFGWIVGEGASFYQYNKQNNSWSYFKNIEIDKKDLDKKSKPMIDVRAVLTISKTSAWAVSSGENIFKFDGKKWNRVTCDGVTEQLYGITFQNNTGWAVGENGIILTCVEGKWKKVNSPTTNRLRSVHFENADLGFAVGDAGTILKYEKGIWSVMPVAVAAPETIKLRSVVMLSDQLAWAVGDKGMVLCYNGKEWTACKEKITNGILTKVWFTAAGAGWACGQNNFLNFEAAAIDEDIDLHASEPKETPTPQASLTK